MGVSTALIFHLTTSAISLSMTDFSIILCRHFNINLHVWLQSFTRKCYVNYIENVINKTRWKVSWTVVELLIGILFETVNFWISMWDWSVSREERMESKIKIFQYFIEGVKFRKVFLMFWLNLGIGSVWNTRKWFCC